MTLNAILNGKRSITTNTALKISKFFGLSERFWINLQSDYDIRIAKHKLAAELDGIQTFAGVEGVCTRIFSSKRSL